MNPSSSILGSHLDDATTAEDATAKLNRKLADKKAAESLTQKGKSSTSLPVWQQVVTDERGIRRFHGAFTGGFSAGYGGTVGSKDGFTPTQFVSSRSKRAAIVESTIEDFMDDEDKANNLLADSGALHSSQDFAGLSRAAQKRPPSLFSDDEHAILGASTALGEVFTIPLHDSAGVRLMRVLGWRHGHGIGPRSANIERASVPDSGHDSDEDHHTILENALKASKHVDAGLHVNMSITDNMEGRMDSHGASFAFAPKDVAVQQFQPKTNFHGIGFKPGMQTSDFGRTFDAPNRKVTEQRVSFGSMSGSVTGAFGLGIDEEADDLDIYESLGSSRAGLSAALVDIGDKHARPKSPTRVNTVSDKGSHDISALRKCQDGRYPLEGFVLALDPDAPSREYPPPKVPVGFDLIKRFDSVLQLPVWVQKQDKVAGFSADQRAVILGEAKGALPSFSSGPPPALSDTEKKTLAFSLSDRFARSTTDSNDFSKDGVKMFPHEEEKQFRFEKYLSALKDNRTPSAEDVYGSRLKKFSLWQQRQEFDEFQRAAGDFITFYHFIILNCTSYTFGFVLGIVLSSASAPPPALSCEAPVAKVLQTPGSNARTCIEWRPSKLLCKRFNVPDPFFGRAETSQREQSSSNRISKTMDTAALLGISSSLSMSAVVDVAALERLAAALKQTADEDQSKQASKAASQCHVQADMSKVVSNDKMAVMTEVSTADNAEPLPRAPDDLFTSIFGTDEGFGEDVELPPAVVPVTTSMTITPAVVPISNDELANMYSAMSKGSGPTTSALARPRKFASSWDEAPLSTAVPNAPARRPAELPAKAVKNLGTTGDAASSASDFLKTMSSDAYDGFLPSMDELQRDNGASFMQLKSRDSVNQLEQLPSWRSKLPSTSEQITDASISIKNKVNVKMQALAAAREALVSSSVGAAPLRPEIITADIMHGPSLPPPGSAWTGPSWQPKPVSWGSAPSVRGSHASVVVTSSCIQPLNQNLVQSSDSHQELHPSSSSSQREVQRHSSKHKHRDSKSYSDREHKSANSVPFSNDVDILRKHHSDRRSDSEAKFKEDDRGAEKVKDGHNHKHHRDDRAYRSHHRH
jgi:hypothetical protein